MKHLISPIPEFSIVIPTLDNYGDVPVIISAINAQTLTPKEIIIVDSSSLDDIEDGIAQLQSAVPIKYLRVGRAYLLDRFLYRFFSLPFLSTFRDRFPIGRAFPYEATNAGSAVAKYTWLAFLDATTIPAENWLEDYWHFLCLHNCDVVFGKTKYLASTRFQKILRASTYGKLGHETAPGSIIQKVHFLDGNKITEGVRSGGDVAWKSKIKNSLKYYLPENSYLTYANLPLSIHSCLKKFFIYQIHGSFLDIQNNIKDLYLGLSLLLCIIVIPKWNYIVGWESPLFIPHITKIFFFSCLLVLAVTFLINRGLLRSFSKNSFTTNILKATIFFMVSYSIFRWNALIANWVEDSIWYIPHITKIFVIGLFSASFLYRGIFFPIKNNIELSYLFPWRWVLVGLLGIILDIIKAPGYVLGALLATFMGRGPVK